MADNLASALGDSVGALSARLRLLYASSDPGGPGFVALATLRHLRRRGAQTVTALAEADRVTTQAVSLRLKPLEEARLVVRQSDPEDRRRTLVSVTVLGVHIVEAAERRAANALKSAVARLSDADRDLVGQAVPVLAALAADLLVEA